MADAVHYLCATDSSMPPVTATGCTGWPFLLSYTSPTDDYPIIVPEEESTNTSASIARWFYRVKKWKISTDFTVTDSATPTPNVYSLTSGTLPNGFVNNPTRELDTIMAMSTGNNQFREYGFPYTVNGTSFAQTGQIDIVSSLNAGPSVAPIIVSGSDFYPYLFLDVTLDSINLSFNDPAATDSVSGSIDGIPITIQIFDASGGLDTYSITQFDITPEEYWPYAAADGSPIYDTSSGAVLQNPQN